MWLCAVAGRLTSMTIGGGREKSTTSAVIRKRVQKRREPIVGLVRVGRRLHGLLEECGKTHLLPEREAPVLQR